MVAGGGNMDDRSWHRDSHAEIRLVFRKRTTTATHVYCGIHFFPFDKVSHEASFKRQQCLVQREVNEVSEFVSVRREKGAEKKSRGDLARNKRQLPLLELKTNAATPQH